MKNLFLQLVFICVLNGVNFESVENNEIEVRGSNKAVVDDTGSSQRKIENANFYQISDDGPKEVILAVSENVAPVHRQSESKVEYESKINYPVTNNVNTKRDKKSLKKSLNKKVKSSNDVEEDYSEAVEDDLKILNEQLEKEYVKQIQEEEKVSEDNDDENKTEETINEDEDSEENSEDQDNNEEEEVDSSSNLSDGGSVSCGSKPNEGSSGKRRKDKSNWFLLQPNNNSLTRICHKDLLRTEDGDTRRNKKGAVRHELDVDKYKMKDLKDMNTMKKKLLEDDMYKQIMVNLDSDSEKEKENKKWGKYKAEVNIGTKRKKQRNKGKYMYLNNNDITHDDNQLLVNNGKVYGRGFGKVKFKPSYSADYTDVHEVKENKGNAKHSAKKKHRKPLRKFKDNFEDIINNKISKCKDSSSDDSKKQSQLWRVENKDDNNVANKQQPPHGNSINKHGKMKHFLENDSKFQSDDLFRDKNYNNRNNDKNPPIQVYRVDVENRKIVPVIEGEPSIGKRRDVYNSYKDSNYKGLPYNISIEFLKEPEAKDVRKRSLKYFNEEYSPLRERTYNSGGSNNKLLDERMLVNDPPAYDTNSVLKEEAFADVYNAWKAKNPQFFSTEHVRSPGYFGAEHLRNTKLSNPVNENINKVLKNFNTYGNVYSSIDNTAASDIYSRYPNKNNIYLESDKNEMRGNEDVEDNFRRSRHQYVENNIADKEIDTKRDTDNINNSFLSGLSKLVQKKAAKHAATSTEVDTTDQTESTTCMELFTKFKGENNNAEENDDREVTSTDGGQWVTIPSVCMTNRTEPRAGKSKTTQPAKHGGAAATVTGTSQQPRTAPTKGRDKFPDMLSGKLADRFFEQLSKKLNRSRKLSRELGWCNEKYKPDPTRRCIENGAEELLPLSSLKNIMYTLKQNQEEGWRTCSAIPSELNSFLSFIIGNAKQKPKECLAVKKESNFLFKNVDTSKDDSKSKQQNDFNLIPEKQLNLEKSKKNRKTGKTDFDDTEEKLSIDEVLAQNVLSKNKSKNLRNEENNRNDAAELFDDILQDGDSRLPRSDIDRSKPNNDYDYNSDQLSPTNVNYGNKDLERFYYGNSDTNSGTKSAYDIFKDTDDISYNADDNVDRNSRNNKKNKNDNTSFKNPQSKSIFTKLSDKIFKNKPAKKHREEFESVKAKRQRLSDNTKIKMHNLLYEDGVREDDDEYYDDEDDVRVKKDTENSNAYEGEYYEDDAYAYDDYDLPFADEKRIADDSDLEDAFVVRTPVEQYNSYYE